MAQPAGGDLMARGAYRHRPTGRWRAGGPLVPSGYSWAPSLASWVAQRTGGHLAWADVVTIAERLRSIEGAVLRWQGGVLVHGDSVPDPLESLL